MKNIQNLIRPYLAVVLGVLLLLSCLNYFMIDDAIAILVGVFATIFAAYYIGYGIVTVVASEKIPDGARKPLDVVAICLFPIFQFIISLISVIGDVKNFGPAGWIILILSMVSSIAFPVCYAIDKFVKGSKLDRVVYLLGIFFAITLIVNLIFTAGGAPINIGQLSVVGIMIDATYLSMMFTSYKKDKTIEIEAKEKEKK